MLLGSTFQLLFLLLSLSSPVQHLQTHVRLNLGTKMPLGTYATTTACPKVLLPWLSSTLRCSSHAQSQPMIYSLGITDPHLLPGSMKLPGEAGTPHYETRPCGAHPGSRGVSDSAASLLSCRRAERDETSG